MITVLYVVGGLVVLWILITVVMAVIRGVLRARESGKLKGAEDTEKREKQPKKPKKQKKKSANDRKKAPKNDPDDKTATREMH